MAQIAVVLFLARYKKISGLDDRAFFGCFSLAIYDFLETRKQENRHHEIKDRYKELIEDLEKATLETTQVNIYEKSHLTKGLLELCLKGEHQDFCQELRPFLQVFIWDYQKLLETKVG